MVYQLLVIDYFGIYLGQLEIKSIRHFNFLLLIPEI